MDEQIQPMSFDEIPTSDPQLTLFSLQDLAITTTRTLQGIQEELKTATQMLTDAYKNDPTFHEEDLKVKEVRTGLDQAKLVVSKQPSVLAIQNKIRELRNEAKEKKSAISDYAIEVLRQTQSNQFVKDGETFEIVTVAKLIKRD